MKLKVAPIAAFATAITLTVASQAVADSRVATLCGPSHVNEVAGADDVSANPDGFYIRSLQTQISHGDPRIIRSNSSGYQLCTISAATPDMDTTKAHLLMNERRVKFLFVPMDPLAPPSTS